MRCLKREIGKAGTLQNLSYMLSHVELNARLRRRRHLQALLLEPRTSEILRSRTAPLAAISNLV